MIHQVEIGELAELYDRFANALERLSPDRLVARRQFYARLESLFQREGAGVEFETFRFEMVTRCKQYLKRN